MSLTKQNQGFNRVIHTKISYFDGHPNFQHLNFPTTIPLHLWPPTLQNKSRRHMTKIVSCNPPQYKSHHHKQHLINHHKQDWSLLALTSVYKIKKKFSPSASDHEFGPAPTPPLPSHILFHSSHKIQGEPFHPWGHKKKSRIHFLAPKIIVPLICFRNKKTAS